MIIEFHKETDIYICLPNDLTLTLILRQINDYDPQMFLKAVSWKKPSGIYDIRRGPFKLPFHNEHIYPG